MIRRRILASAFVGLGLLAAVLLTISWRLSGTTHASADTLARGQEIYAEYCASCHGDNLEGQPDWQQRLPSGRLPAPPHDVSGHTWHHPDGVLFRITKEGSAAVVGGGYESDMEGFGTVLSDEEITAVLEFIKSTWPEREREYQSGQSQRERDEAK